MKSRKIGILLSYVNTGLNMVCGLFLSSFLLRMLGALEYGIYQTIASFANYLVMLQFGTGTVMTRNIAMCKARNAPQEELDRNVNAIWSLTIVLASLICAVGVAFYLSIGKIYDRTMDTEQIMYARRIFLYVLIHLISSFLMQTMNGAVLACENYGFASLQHIIRTVLRTAALVLLILCWQESILIAQVDAAVSIAQLIVVACYLRKLGIRLRISKPDRDIMRTTAPLCLALFLQTIVNQANNNVDKFLIGIMLSPESVSVYSVAMYVFSIFSSMTTIPISMYAPAVAKAIQRKTAMSQLEEELVHPCRMTAIIGGMIYFGFLSAGRQFISVVYGSEYLIAWPIALLVMTPMYINMINGVLVNVLDAMNKRMVRSLALMGTTLMNILLTIIWLQKWGLIGAALATAVCTLVGQVMVMNLYYSQKLHINIGRLFRGSLTGVLFWFAISTIASLLIGKLIVNQFVSLLTAVIVFLAVWVTGYLWKGITQEEKSMIRKIIHR